MVEGVVTIDSRAPASTLEKFLRYEAGKTKRPIRAGEIVQGVGSPP
jgi:hypothetical protein